MTAKQHIDRAKDYAAKGDDYYAKAADEIIAAREADPTLGWRAIAKTVGRSRYWCEQIVRWRTSGMDQVHGPFGGQEENEARYARHDKRKIEDVLDERPEAVVDAIRNASDEVRALLVLTLADLFRDESTKGKKAPTPRVPKTPSLRLEQATISLWEIGELLMDEVPTPEDRVRMLSAAEKALRLASGIVALLDTGELDQEFSTLLQEVGSDR